MFIKVGDFVIAARHSIKVRDEEININLRSDSDSKNGSANANCSSGSGSGSGSCVSQIKNREIVFTLEFVGQARSNQVLYNQLDEYLADICVNAPAIWQRRACDEDIEQFMVTGAYMRRLDMDRERYGVRTGEVHLITQDEGQSDIIQITLEPLPPSIT